jgi:hypothetical protein
VCSCNAGYTPISSTQCVDINECTGGVGGTGPANGGCSPLSVCYNTNGSFICGPCPVGFAGDGFTCTDIDECAAGTHQCTQNAGFLACQNVPGSYVCTCQSGYTLSPVDQRTCVDINECVLGNGGCQQICTNSPGSYSCSCQPGYTSTYNGGTVGGCFDINECTTLNGGCGNVSVVTCSNVPGSFQCSCNAGYVPQTVTAPPQPLNCVDINECATSNANLCASLGATCTNVPGSYQCACNPGFAGDGQTCVDINECANNNGGCGNNITCVNTIGSFSCGCPPGYTGTVNGCVDINECVTSPGVCSASAVCTNTPGDYVCTCRPGYTGTGYGPAGCQDINECAQPGVCGPAPLTVCTNTPGNYTCGCISGYRYVTGPVSTTRCFDINECVTTDPLFRANCSTSGSCQNVPGSFVCNACPSGFTGDGFVCTDINECQTLPRPCFTNGTCVNSPGSYACAACPSGYQGTGKLATGCQDINECAYNNGGCSEWATCTNTPGSRTCTCKSGYSGNGVLCAAVTSVCPRNCLNGSICTRFYYVPIASPVYYQWRCICQPTWVGRFCGVRRLDRTESGRYDEDNNFEYDVSTVWLPG